MKTLAENLKTLGVESIYFCSGARNYPLLESFRGFDLSFHFEERSTSFLALGEAIQTKKPVVVCTTSGTAVAECYSALIEAYYKHVPLIIVSADRPSRLRGTSAPQCIDQQNIFGKYSRTFINLDSTSEFADEIKYPFHINIEIDDSNIDDYKKCEDISDNDFIKEFKNYQKPVFVFSESKNNNQNLLDYILEKNQSVYIEPLSNLKKTNQSFLIHNDEEFLHELASNKIDAIIKIGDTPVSKVWRVLDNKYIDIPVYSIGEDPHGLFHGYRLKNSELLFDLDFKEQKPNIHNEHIINNTCECYPESELTIFKQIIESFESNSNVYLGNSMPIRLLQYYNKEDQFYYASRGANGIDGQISTAIGIATKSNEMTYAILGDLTFLYDFNILFYPWPKNFELHILNNNGGRIFDKIGLSKEIQNEHSINFEQVLAPFNKNIKIWNISNHQSQELWQEIKQEYSQ